VSTGSTPAPPVTIPAAPRRPGSASWSDAYGALGFPGSQRTASAGGEGAAREAAAAHAGGAPLTINGIGPDFLARPAGALIVLIGALAAWSYFDR
jgi:hypothetical protein